MERNVALLHDIAEQIEREPYRHDQKTFCGSAMCVAGWAFLLSGEYEIVRDENGEFGVEYDFINIETGSRPTDERATAAELLGLQDDELDTIYFHMGPPAHDLTWPEALYKIAAGEDVHYTMRGWHKDHPI